MLSSCSEGYLVPVGVFYYSGVNTSQSSCDGQECVKVARQELIPGTIGGNTSRRSPAPWLTLVWTYYIKMSQNTLKTYK